MSKAYRVFFQVKYSWILEIKLFSSENENFLLSHYIKKISFLCCWKICVKFYTFYVSQIVHTNFYVNLTNDKLKYVNK